MSSASSLIQWGDVATWVSAVATLLALLAAGLAARASFKMLRIENAREKDRAEQDVRSQANLVAVWQSDSVPADDDHLIALGLEALDDSQQAEVEVFTLRNASELPVFDVKVNRPGMIMTFTWDVLPPGDHPFSLGVSVRRQGSWGDKHYAPPVWFTDSSGNHWRRDSKGVLYRMDTGAVL